MSGVTGAIVGAAVVGAGATMYAGNKAAGATRDASNAAISQQQQALQQQSQLSAPYRSLGESAIPTLQSLLGIGGPQRQVGGTGSGPQGGSGMPLGGGPTGSGFQAWNPNGGPIPGGNGAREGSSGGGPGGITDTLRSMPGYQFLQEQGTKGTVNQASAMGLGLSGNTLQGLSQFNQGLADNQYQQFVGNLENVVGMGQAAAAGQAANIGNAANNTSNIMMNQGNTMAGIQANTIAGITKSLGNGANQYMMNNTLSGLYNPNSDPSAWDTENPGNFQDF